MLILVILVVGLLIGLGFIVFVVTKFLILMGLALVGLIIFLCFAGISEILGPGKEIDAALLTLCMVGLIAFLLALFSWLHKKRAAKAEAQSANAAKSSARAKGLATDNYGLPEQIVEKSNIPRWPFP